MKTTFDVVVIRDYFEKKKKKTYKIKIKEKKTKKNI